jgi:hypothetical protein
MPPRGQIAGFLAAPRSFEATKSSARRAKRDSFGSLSKVTSVVSSKPQKYRANIWLRVPNGDKKSFVRALISERKFYSTLLETPSLSVSLWAYVELKIRWDDKEIIRPVSPSFVTNPRGVPWKLFANKRGIGDSLVQAPGC